MKLISALLLTLCFAILMFPQTKEVLRLRAELDFAGPVN